MPFFKPCCYLSASFVDLIPGSFRLDRVGMSGSHWEEVTAWLPSWDPVIATLSDLISRAVRLLSRRPLIRSPGSFLLLMKMGGVGKPPFHVLSLPGPFLSSAGVDFLSYGHCVTFAKGKTMNFCFIEKWNWRGLFLTFAQGIDSSRREFTVSRKNHILSWGSSLSQVPLATNRGMISSTLGSQQDCRSSLILSSFHLQNPESYAHKSIQPGPKWFLLYQSGISCVHWHRQRECIWRWPWVCPLTFCPSV